MRTQRARALLILLLIPVLVLSCAAKSAQSMDESVMVERPAAAPAPMKEEAETYSGEGAASDSGSELPQRMIIRTVGMSVVVDDTDVMLDMLEQMVTGQEGYIASSNRWLSGEQAYADVTIRVPAAGLNSMVEAIEGMSIRVENKNTSGQDVTEEYYDLDARLRNLRATEAELLQLLTEIRENRGDAEEVLAIHREITEIRGQIESLQGRQQYLERMTAMATINLSIRPKEAPRSIVEPDKWNPLVTASNALRGFVKVLQFFVDLLITLVIYSPFILIPALVIWLLARWLKRRKKAKAKDDQE